MPKIALVTGSSGLLGHALCERLIASGDWQVRGIDVRPGEFTTHLGSFCDSDFVASCCKDANVIFHCGALHKPHVATHTREQFVLVNIEGTKNLLASAVAADSKVEAFVFTSSTSVFGYAMKAVPTRAREDLLQLFPAKVEDESLEKILKEAIGEDSDPRADSGSVAAAASAATRGKKATVWVHEELSPIPHNIYALTKLGAERICKSVNAKHGLPIHVLRLARFFPDEDDELRKYAQCDANIKTNEFSYRRLHLHDTVNACIASAGKLISAGRGVEWKKSGSSTFDTFIITATTPFSREDCEMLASDARAVIAKRIPAYKSVYEALNWTFFDSLDRVYDNSHAREALEWNPHYNFSNVVDEFRSVLKGYASVDRDAWQRDEDAKSCNSCDSVFTLLLRKHHCRHCGRVYCGRCAPKRTFASKYAEETRLCGSCIEFLSVPIEERVSTVLEKLGTDSSGWKRTPSGVARVNEGEAGFTIEANEMQHQTDPNGPEGQYATIRIIAPASDALSRIVQPSCDANFQTL